MTDLTAKARRADVWWEAVKGQAVRHVDNDVWRMGEIPYGRLWPTTGLIRRCEEEGWQDQDTKPPEFVGFKGVESATVEADGVEWHVGSEWAIVNGHTIAIECGQTLFTWVVFQDGEPGVVVRSNPVTPPHTREEARRQAVEAARGMNNENV